jgi:hypothetical protein
VREGGHSRLHDLRGSAVVRLALADATVPQIATFTGHSLRDVEAILDAHYLGRDEARNTNKTVKCAVKRAWSVRELLVLSC